jgi:internalin A
VRGLILLVLVVGVWLGWIIRSARIQREAVAAIQRAGGTGDESGTGSIFQ